MTVVLRTINFPGIKKAARHPTYRCKGWRSLPRFVKSIKCDKALLPSPHPARGRNTDLLPLSSLQKTNLLNLETLSFLPFFVGMKIELIELRYSSNFNSMIPKRNNVHIVHVTEIDEGRVGVYQIFCRIWNILYIFPLVKYDLCPPPLTLQPRYFKYYPRSEKYAHNESMRIIHKLCSLEARNMPGPCVCC